MGVPLFGQEHVDRSRETDGEEGHDWQGTTVLLLTTTGRNSGAKRTTPLIYQRDGDDYLVWPPTTAAIHPAVSSTFKRSDRGRTGQGRPPHARAGRHGRGEARAVAHHDRDWGALRRVQAKADREIPVVVREPG
jgi:hypothetical protein